MSIKYLNTFNFRAPLIFAHPLKMNFRAPVNFRAPHKFRGTFEVFLMKNIDKKGKKETKLELLLTLGVLSSKNLHPNGIFNLNRGQFVRN